MASGFFLLAFVTIQRLAELVHAQRNTSRLIAAGAVEHGASHYPLMVGFHATWLVSMWVLGWDAAIVPVWLAAYAILQVFRIWILASLGRRWTTRIIVTDEPLVRRGPYRFMSHPNYLLVMGEIAVLPLALGQPWAALGFSIVHLGVLAIRIKAENAALAASRTS